MGNEQSQLGKNLPGEIPTEWQQPFADVHGEIGYDDATQQFVTVEPVLPLEPIKTPEDILNELAATTPDEKPDILTTALPLMEKVMQIGNNLNNNMGAKAIPGGLTKFNSNVNHNVSPESGLVSRHAEEPLWLKHTSKQLQSNQIAQRISAMEAKGERTVIHEPIYNKAPVPFANRMMTDEEVKDLNEYYSFPEFKRRDLLQGSDPAAERRVDIRYRNWINYHNAKNIKHALREYMEESCRQGAKSTGCPVARAVLDHVNEIKNLDLKQLSLEETDRAIQAQIQPIRHKIGQMVSAYTQNRLDVPDNLGWVAERLCPKFKVAPGNHGYINEEYTFQPQLVMTTKIYKNIQNAAQQATDIINAVVQHRKDNLLTQYYIAVRNTLVALKKIHFISNGKRSRAKHMEWLEAEGIANVDEAWGDLQFRNRNGEEIDQSVIDAMEDFLEAKHRLDDHMFQKRVSERSLLEGLPKSAQDILLGTDHDNIEDLDPTFVVEQQAANVEGHTQPTKTPTRHPTDFDHNFGLPDTAVTIALQGTTAPADQIKNPTTVPTPVPTTEPTQLAEPPIITENPTASPIVAPEPSQLHTEEPLPLEENVEEVSISSDYDDDMVVEEPGELRYSVVEIERIQNDILADVKVAIKQQQRELQDQIQARKVELINSSRYSYHATDSELITLGQKLGIYDNLYWKGVFYLAVDREFDVNNAYIAMATQKRVKTVDKKIRWMVKNHKRQQEQNPTLGIVRLPFGEYAHGHQFYGNRITVYNGDDSWSMGPQDDNVTRL